MIVAAASTVGGRIGMVRLRSLRSVALVCWAAAVIVSLSLLVALPRAFERSDRVAVERAPVVDFSAQIPVSQETWVQERSTIYRGRPIAIVVLDSAPSARPPGVRRLPAPGELIVSPALAKILRTERARTELGNRLPGRVAGIVGSSGLRRPEELFAYVGARRPAGVEAGGERLRGWGYPAGTFSTQPFSPALAFALAVLVAVPLLGLGVLAINAGSSGRALVLSRLDLLGAWPSVAATVLVIEAAVPVAVGMAVGVLLRHPVAGVVASRYPASVRPFASDLVGAGAATASRAVVACLLLAAVALVTSWRRLGQGRLTPARVPASRSRRLALVAWAFGLVAVSARVVGTSELSDVDLLLALVVLLGSGLVVPWFSLGLASTLRRTGLVDAELAHASLGRSGSSVTRASQALAVAGGGLVLALCVIIVWDGATLIDAGFGRGRTSAADAMVVGEWSSLQPIARTHRDQVARALLLDDPAQPTSGPDHILVVRCRDAERFMVDWRPGRCGRSFVTTSQPSWPARLAPFHLGAVELPGGSYGRVEPRVLSSFLGGTGVLIVTVADAEFDQIDRTAARQPWSDEALVRLEGDAEARSVQVERLREGAGELWAPPVAFAMEHSGGSDVITLADRDADARWYREVYGTAVHLLGGFVLGLAALAFLLGTIADVTESQPMTDRLDLLGASRARQLRTALLRSGVALIGAVVVGVAVGSLLGLRYLRTAGYGDLFPGWSAGFPLGATLTGALAILGTGLVVVSVAALGSLRPRPVERLHDL